MSGPGFAGMGPTSAGGRQRAEQDEPSYDPVERAAAQSAQRATLAEQLEREAKALATVPAREWAERKADLDQRLAQAQARAVTTFDLDAAATLARTADLLAAAKPPPPVPALPGEDAIRPGVEDRTADPGDVLDWVAGLPAASRRELWHRYEQASSGARAKGAAADEFARELANYVARRRIRADLHRLTSMSERQVRAWRAAHHQRRAAAGLDEHPDTAERGPAGPATEIGAAGTGVEEAVAKARLPFSGGHHEVAIARAIRGLTAAIDHAPGKLSATDREAIGRALRIANDHAQRTGPGVGRAIHGPLLEAQAAAGRHGYAIDVATEALLPDGAAAVSAGDLRELTERSERQIARAIPQLRAWQLDAEADELQRMVNLVGWAAHTRQGLDEAGRKRALLQAQTLFEAAGELDVHIQLATSAGIAPGTAEHRAFAKVLRAYAHAMARSGVDPDPLAEARLEKQRLPLNLARASSAAGRAGLDTLTELDPRQAKHAERAYDGLDKRIHELDGRLHEGAAVDAADVAELAVRARELSFKNRVLTMEAQLEALASAATKADEGWVAFFANAYAIDFKALPGKLREQRGFMAGFRAGLDRNVRDALARIDDPDPKRRALREVEARRAAVDFVEQHLADYLKTERLQQMLEGAIHAINDAGTRAIVTELIAQAAVMLAMSAGAGVVAAQVGKVAAAGTTLAAESVVSAASAARLASVAGFVTTVAADAALNTAGQKLLLNDQASWKTLFTTNAAVSLALAPLGGLFARWGSSVSEAEVRTAKLWQARGARIIATTAQITFEMVAAAAVDYAVRRAEHEKTQSLDEMTVTQWLLQGATMALGRAIGSRMQGIHERFGAWAERTAFTPEQLARVKALALAAETHGRTADAQEAAIEYARLVEAEHEALQAMVRDGGGDPAKLRTLLAGNEAARAELGTSAFAELPLRLAGLEPENAAGLLWRGSPDEIQAAIKAVQDGGHPIEVVARGSASTPWRLRLGGRELEVVETPPRAARAKRKAPPQAPSTSGPKSHGEASGATGADAQPTDGDATVASPEQSAGGTRTQAVGGGVDDEPSPLPRTRPNRDPFSPEGRAENAAVIARGEPGYNEVVGYVGGHDDGLALMQRLLRGDASALAEVGFHREGGGKFDPASREWGLGKVDGKYVLIAGEQSTVDWSVVAGVEPIAHSHPRDMLRVIAQDNRVLDVTTMVTKPADTNNMDAGLFFASPADIAALFHMRSQHPKMQRHDIALPYEHVGGTSVVLAPEHPSGRPPVTLVLENPTYVGTQVSDGAMRYRATARLEANGKAFWHGTIDAVIPHGQEGHLEFGAPSVPMLQGGEPLPAATKTHAAGENPEQAPQPPAAAVAARNAGAEDGGRVAPDAAQAPQAVASQATGADSAGRARGPIETPSPTHTEGQSRPASPADSTEHDSPVSAPGERGSAVTHAPVDSLSGPARSDGQSPETSQPAIQDAAGNVRDASNSGASADQPQQRLPALELDAAPTPAHENASNEEGARVAPTATVAFGEGARSLRAPDVETAVAQIDASGALTGDLAIFADTVRKAKLGDEGSLGELEAVLRWTGEGKVVEVLPEHENQGVRNPDYRVDGKLREVKTGSEPLGDRTIVRKIDDANNQIKRSGLRDGSGKPELGGVDVQLRGELAEAPFDAIERQVRRQFNAGRSRSLDSVRVFREAQLVGEWYRLEDGSVARRFPAQDRESAQ